MHAFARRPLRGLTLTEVMVAIAIVIALAALIVPAVQAARESARAGQCASNLRQLAMGVHGFHDTYRYYPPGGLDFWPDPPRLPFPPPAGTAWYNQWFDWYSWHYHVLPYMEELNLFNEGADEDDAAPHGPAVLDGKGAKHLRCPSDWFLGKPSTTNYVGSCGPTSLRGEPYAHVAPNICRDVFGPGYANRPDLGYTETDPSVSGIFTALKDARGMFVPKTIRCGGPNSAAGVCKNRPRMPSRDGVIRIRDLHITDGTGNVLMLGENLPGESGSNTNNAFNVGGGGRGYYVLSTVIPINTFTVIPPHAVGQPGAHTACQLYGDLLPGNWATSVGFKSRHASGANFAFGDGSVRFLSDTLNHDTFQQLGCRNDGFPVVPP